MNAGVCSRGSPTPKSITSIPRARASARHSSRRANGYCASPARIGESCTAHSVYQNAGRAASPISDRAPPRARGGRPSAPRGSRGCRTRCASWTPTAGRSSSAPVRRRRGERRVGRAGDAGRRDGRGAEARDAALRGRARDRRACASGTAIRPSRLLDADEGLNAMLLERCEPGTVLRSLPEPEQDVAIADDSPRRLWRTPREPHPFRPLRDMAAIWSDEARAESARWLDARTRARGARAVRPELPRPAREPTSSSPPTSTRATSSGRSASRGSRSTRSRSSATRRTTRRSTSSTARAAPHDPAAPLDRSVSPTCCSSTTTASGCGRSRASRSRTSATRPAQLGLARALARLSRAGSAAAPRTSARARRSRPARRRRARTASRPGRG